MIFTHKYHTPQKLENSDPHYFEINAQKIVDIIQMIIEKCTEITTNIGGILFSTQQHGCVLHHPQRLEDTYISWQDTRCLKQNPKTNQSYLEDLQDLLPPEVMLRTGVPVKPALALCNLYTLFQEESLSKQGDIQVYTLGSYIIKELTGNNICHITNAAPMGFVDLHKRCWDTDILTRTGMDFIQLPEITTELVCCGTYQNQGITIPVYPDFGDVQTSVYGIGAKSGDMIINIGTSGQLIMIRDDYEPGEYEIRPYYENNYCYVISRMPGGRNFDVQIDYLRQVGQKIFGINLDREEIWNRIQNRCMVSDTNGLEVDCSFYELPDRLADGKIMHINHANFTLENVIAATAIDYGRQYRRFADMIWKGRPFDGTLYFSGGAVLKNPFLKKAIQDAMGCSKVASAPKDEVYSGLFHLAKRCVLQK
ncbi:MAG: FGGY-N domain-containing protein [Clostridium sp.]